VGGPRGLEYLKVAFDRVEGRPPTVDLTAERALHEAVIQGIELGYVRSAHDCSEGGVVVALAECCIAGDVGARIRRPRGSAGRGAVLRSQDASSSAWTRRDATEFELSWARSGCPT